MVDTFQAFLVTVLFVLPGALFTWYLEREIGRWGIGASDRLLRFVGASAIFQSLYAYPTYILWQRLFHHRVGREPTQFENILLTNGHVPWWIFLIPILYVAIPIAAGTLAGWAVRRRRSSVRARRVARILVGRDPAPRAWDNLFGENPSGVVRVHLKDGARLGGLFAGNSYAAGYPEQPQDLFLERVYLVNQSTGEFRRDDQGSYVETGSGILLRWDDIGELEFFRIEEADNANGGSDG